MSTVPPRKLVGDDAYRWSVAVTTILLIQGVVLMVQISLVWGLLPALFGGFATNKDVAIAVEQAQTRIERVVKDSTNDLKASMLLARIYNYRQAQCKAIKENNGAAAQSLNQQIESARNDYFLVVQTPYDLRPCSEFGY